MTTASEPRVWPRPYLLDLYARAVEEGCIRVLVRDHDEFKSLKGAFHRIRRRVDAQHLAMIRPEYHFCTMSWEAERGTALITYSSLPDNQTLPAIESVTGQRSLPQPQGAIPSPTPEVEPDFDATAHVSGLLAGLNIEEDEEPTDEL